MTRGRQSFGPFVAFFLLLSLAATSISGGQARAQAFNFDIDAKAALLIDADTGQVLFEKNADDLLEPASLSKIMTLLVTMDAVKAGQVSLDDPVRASRRANQTGGSRVWLEVGEVHSLRQMLKAVAIASGNDASVAVAEYIAGTEAAFAQKMTERARQLGMTKSVFHNSHGLPPGPGESASYTTAREIAIAAQTLIREHPEVLEWTSTVMEKFRDRPEFILYNTNRLVSTYDGLDGLKTGHTNSAGWSLVATAKRGDMRIISVVMGTESQNAREERTRVLLDHAFNRHVRTVVAEGTVGEITIANGVPEQVPVVLAEPARVLVPRGNGVDVQGRVEPNEHLQAPVSADTRVGDYVVVINGHDALRVPIYVEQDVTAAGFFMRMWRSVRNFVLDLLS